MYALMVRMGPLTAAYADVNAYLTAHVSDTAKVDTRSDAEKRAALKRAMAEGRRR